MSWYNFWKTDREIERLDEEIKSFKNKLEKPMTQTDVKNKTGEGFEDIQLIQGFGNIGLSSFNMFYKQYINRFFENEVIKIREYRNMSTMSEIADVIEDAVNESTLENDEGETITLKINDPKLKENENIVNNIQEEFKELFYNRIDINNILWDLFHTYYIDGRVYYERIIDAAHPSNGIIGIKKLPSESMDYLIDPVTGEIKHFFQYLSDRPRRPSTLEEAKEAKDIIIFDRNQISFINYGIYGRNKYEILGYLEKAKVPYNQLKLLETSVVIYRLIRAPERFVFRIDTGSMPMEKAMKFVESVKNKMSKKQSFDPNTGRLTQEPEILSLLENFYLPQCLRTSTKIDLLDGRTLTLQEIIKEHQEGKKHEVYSVDQKSGKIIKGEVEWAGITRKNAEMVRVWLDTDEYIDCTPDHKFVLRDGNECRADMLEKGQSLMPLYQRNEKINKNTNDYRQVFDMKDNKWKFVHRVVGPLPMVGNAIHHKDFNRFNNMSDNLISMPIKEHVKLHSDSNKERKSHIPMLNALNKPENREKQRSAVKKFMLEKFKDPNERTKISTLMKNRWNNDEDYRSKMVEAASKPKTLSHKKSLSKSIKDKWKNDKNYREISSLASKNRWKNEEFAKMMSNKQSCVIDDKCRYFIVLELIRGNFPSLPVIIKRLSSNSDFMQHWCNINIDKKGVRKDKLGKDGFYSIVKSFDVVGYKELKNSIVINHKVKKVEKLSVREDTGCLTIRDHGNNHNFAVAAGVFVKNSADGRGSTIESIGGNSAGFTQLDDLYYFARKLFRSLKYPLSRVTASEERRSAESLFGGPSVAEISRDEVKWAKFLERQQKRFCKDLENIFLMHLQFKKIREQYSLSNDSFDIIMTQPSRYKEKMDQSFLLTSFDNYNALADKPEISKYFAMQKYLKWDDETIRENVKGFKKDRELGLVSQEGSIEMQ